VKRRSAIALIVVVVLVLATALMLRWAMRPQTLGPQVLGMTGRALGLKISARDFDYRLRGTPQLVARGVSARAPGARVPLLEAERVFVSVPWSTLRSRGAELTVQRIEVDAPRLALQPFMAWWSQRPPGDGRLPTLSDGLLIEGGEVDGGSWRLRDVRVDMPRFARDARVRGAVSGSWLAASFEVPFHLQVTVTRPAMGAGVGIAGWAGAHAQGWRLDNRLVASTRLEDGAQGASGVRLQRLRLSSASRVESDGPAQEFALGLAADGAYADGSLVLAPAALALRGRDLVPDLHGRGRLALGATLAFDIAGAIEQWPARWPELPAPIGDSDEPLPFRAAYAGATDLSDPLRLELSRNHARFEGKLRVPAVTVWSGALETGSPLPPLEGHLVVPRIDIAGASFHGVEITFDDDNGGRVDP